MPLPYMIYSVALAIIDSYLCDLRININDMEINGREAIFHTLFKEDQIGINISILAQGGMEIERGEDNDKMFTQFQLFDKIHISDRNLEKELYEPQDRK